MAKERRVVGTCELCHGALIEGQKAYKFTDENGYYCTECMHTHIMDIDDLEVDAE